MYDINFLTGPIMSMKRVGSNCLSPNASQGLLDTAETGDAYDAEVEELRGGEFEDHSILESRA